MIRLFRSKWLINQLRRVLSTICMILYVSVTCVEGRVPYIVLVSNSFYVIIYKNLSDATVFVVCGLWIIRKMSMIYVLF